MNKKEFKEVLHKAIHEVDELQYSGIKLSNPEKTVIKGILYSLYYGCD